MISSSIDNCFLEISIDLPNVKGFEVMGYSSLVDRMISLKKDVKQKAKSFRAVDDSDIADSYAILSVFL